jgi:hypothetical protein
LIVAARKEEATWAAENPIKIFENFNFHYYNGVKIKSITFYLSFFVSFLILDPRHGGIQIMNDQKKKIKSRIKIHLLFNQVDDLVESAAGVLNF